MRGAQLYTDENLSPSHLNPVLVTSSIEFSGDNTL